MELLEPAYYWRVARDYDDVPDPVIVPWYATDTLVAIRDRILALDTSSNYNSRVVLHYQMTEADRNTLVGQARTETAEEGTARVVKWAEDSVGHYPDRFDVELRRYAPLPKVKAIRDELGVQEVLNGMRTCKDVFARLRGNRTCFQVCD